jgi:hypothetical protein
MKRSDSVTKIVPALLKAQKLMGGATKGAANPYFKSKYADYGAVLEACKDLLNDNGIAILQPHTFHDGKNFVETTLIHESGEYLTSETEVVCSKQNDPQALGSAITYARRYGLQSLLAMPAEDDDGEKAMGRTAAPKQEAPKAAAPAAKPAQAPAAKVATTPATKSSFKAATPAAPATTTAKPAGANDLNWD